MNNHNYRYEMAIKDLRETLSDWMIKNGFSTGHGDCFSDLLDELQWQIDELRAKK